MTEPKYQIGDRLPYSNHIVRGRMRLSNGTYRYFLQIGKSDNSHVVNSADINYLENYTLPCLVCGCEFCKCG